MLPLQQGWSYGWEPNPDFESAAMRESWKYLSGTLFWAPDLQDEYLAMGFGLWAWCPEQYSFNEVRQYARKTVFGDKWGTAAAFETSLAQLRAMFDRYALRPWPLALGRSPGQAESLAVDCAKRLDSLRENPSTVLDSLRYAERYIAAMEKAVRTAHEYLGLSFHPGVYTDSTPPSAATGLSASFTGMVSLSWNAASDPESGILGYDIFRGSRPDSLSFLRTTPDSNGASDVFDGTGDTLYYAVRAVNRNGLRSLAFSNTVFVVLPAFDSAYLGAGADTLFSFTSTQVRAYVRFSDGTIDSSGLTVRFSCLDTALLSVTASGRALARDTSGIARVIASRGGAWIPDTCRIAVVRSPIRLLKRFDFRCSATPVLADWIPENGSPYDSAKGYGWSGCASPLENRCDRSGGVLLGTFVMVRGSACTTGVFRVDAPDGGYIVRIGLGDASYPAEPLFVMHGKDTIARFTAPGSLGNGYSVCDDTITVSGNAGASFLVRGTPNAKISYLIILSDQGIAISDVAKDGLPPMGVADRVRAVREPPLRLTASPNPFNPRTRIEVSGSREGVVLVYAPSGRLVARLALKNGAAEWNAAALPSGIYLVQARVGLKILKAKAVLLK
jgi:hypothetical protein